MTLSHKISLKLHLGVGYSEMCIILTIAALANHLAIWYLKGCSQSSIQVVAL